MNPDCMKQYRNEFAIKFAQLMQKNLTLWKEIQKAEIKSLYSFGSILIYTIISLIGFVPGKREVDYDLHTHLIFAGIVFIVAIIINIFMVNKRYQIRIKNTLFPELLKIFSEKFKYINNLNMVDKETNISNGEFLGTCLYNRDITSRDDDDRFYGEYEGVPFLMVETDFGWNSHDRHRTYHSMFKGLAMRFTMIKEIKSRVLILSKFSFTSVPKNFEKVSLESSDFAKKYNVYVDSRVGSVAQVEARYLLNTAFMNRLMQIQTSFKINKMCCSIYKNTLMIMLSTNKDLFEMNFLFGKIDDPKQYQHLFEEFASVLAFIRVLNLASKTRL